MPKTKPNLLIFVSDHFRAEALHHLGNTASRTPHFDAFVANEAISIKHAFCQNPVCVPSRCSFLSGFYPHANGYRTMHHLMDEQAPNLLKELKQNGYHIYFGGKNDAFKLEVPVTSYCDDRSDAFDEMAKLMRQQPLKDGYRAIGHMQREEALAAEAQKEASRHDAQSRYYYAIYQGVVDGDNPLAVGYTGAEDLQVADAIRYIENYQGDQPLCVYLPLMLPHPWYACTPEDFAAIQREAIEPCVRLNDRQRALKPSIEEGMRHNHRLYQWDDESLLDFKQTYLAMVHHIDANFQKVLNAFKRRGIYDQTAVLMFSEHGDYAGEYEIAEINQNTFEDFLTNVPLLIKPPKGVPVVPGVRDCLAELVDVVPTVAELCGFELSYVQHGRSLCQLLADPGAKVKDYVFSEGGRLAEEKHCMDAGHQKSMLYWARTSVQEKMPEHTKAVMIRSMRYKYVKRLYEKDEFYDLSVDPKEMENRIDDKAYAKIIDEMQKMMLEFFVRTADNVPMKRDRR